MAETVSLVAALVVVAGVAGGVPLAALDGPPAQATNGTNGTSATNASLAPGERLAGTVGVERAAVAGEIEGRAFGQRMAAANSNDSRAAIVAAHIGDLQTRLDELQAERTALRTAYENGSLSHGQFRARMAQLHAEQRALQWRANHTQHVAGQLPAEARQHHGVNVTALHMVRSQAANLTGPQVAAMARSIAGPGAGHGMGGPPAFAGNGTGPMGPGGAGGPMGPAGDGNPGPGGDGGPMGPGGDGDPAPSDGNDTDGGPGGPGGNGPGGNGPGQSGDAAYPTA
jgi:hypothetical protein